MLFLYFIGALGGLTVFMLGLRIIEKNMSALIRGRLSDGIYRATLNPFAAMGIGAGVTALAQSSVAVNLVVISLADVGAVSFTGACAVVMGTNVGTTVTAQLTTLSFGGFEMFYVGAAFSFTGFILSAAKNEKLSGAGGVFLGFGLVFIGIDILTDRMENFYSLKWFRHIFSVDNGLILALNGFFITALCQSSSVVSSILVILCAAGSVGFEKAAFLLIGANVGTTIPVIFMSRNKSLAARRVALFNLLFNLIGGIAFFAAMLIFGDDLTRALFSSKRSRGAAIADFHTFFNVASAIMILPFLKPLSKVCSLIIKDNQTKTVKKAKNARKATKSFYGSG